MKILAHRGFWKLENEKNTLKSLNEAFNRKYGIETDIRDYDGELVISHNIADGQCPRLTDLFKMYSDCQCGEYMALNIKADGLQAKLKVLLEKFKIQNYFLFDMSIPEMVVNKRENLKFFTRNSDIENECVLYNDAIGVWIDSFYNENWLNPKIISSHLNNNKSVCIISSEIHGFNYQPMWDMLLNNGFSKNENVMLCTDLPDLANEYFGI